MYNNHPAYRKRMFKTRKDCLLFQTTGPHCVLVKFYYLFLSLHKLASSTIMVLQPMETVNTRMSKHEPSPIYFKGSPYPP